MVIPACLAATVPFVEAPAAFFRLAPSVWPYTVGTFRLTTGKQRGKLGEELLKIILPRKLGRLQGDEGFRVLQNKHAHERIPSLAAESANGSRKNSKWSGSISAPMSWAMACTCVAERG